jgi:hypothetical protein
MILPPRSFRSRLHGLLSPPASRRTTAKFHIAPAFRPSMFHSCYLFITFHFSSMFSTVAEIADILSNYYFISQHAFHHRWLYYFRQRMYYIVRYHDFEGNRFLESFLPRLLLSGWKQSKYFAPISKMISLHYRPNKARYSPNIPRYPPLHYLSMPLSTAAYMDIDS